MSVSTLLALSAAACSSVFVLASLHPDTGRCRKGRLHCSTIAGMVQLTAVTFFVVRALQSDPIIIEVDAIVAKEEPASTARGVLPSASRTAALEARGAGAKQRLPEHIRSPEVCHGRGIYHASLRECRCTAGWGGRWCDVRDARPCNRAADNSVLHHESLCAGNCDEDRGLCYCAGLSTSTQRPLPFHCAPAVHQTARLPDFRPALPVRGPSGTWRMANVYFERQRSNPAYGWHAPEKTPFEHVYGPVPGNPASPAAKGRPASGIPFCSANLTQRSDAAACGRGDCPVGRKGPLCEQLSESFCLRNCSGYGRCDAGFCWCEDSWFGIDCSERVDGGSAPLLQERQQLPSPAAASGLRVYVYDMPSEFTTRLLQWRGSHASGLSRSLDPRSGQSHHTAGSLYAMELALHEWLLDSPLRTTDAAEAHLFYVPVYLSSLFMYPIVKFADQPYYGRDARTPGEGGGFGEPRDRSQQGTLLLLRALQHIQREYPHWNASRGRDHVWLMLHDEGPCFCPKQLRSSILLSHYGYYARTPKSWGTFADDLFLRYPVFYRRYLGRDPRKPSACFERRKDLVLPPWKIPSFWQRALRNPPPAERKGIVFFAGDLGFNRIAGYSHDLRQLAFALFCDPRRTQRRDCTPVAYDQTCECECRKDMPQNCSLWKPGVSIQTHSSRYHDELREHVFCLAFPGDGWSSRVLDAVIHGCIPVIVQDDSEMFFEGAFADAGMGVSPSPPPARCGLVLYVFQRNARLTYTHYPTPAPQAWTMMISLCDYQRRSCRRCWSTFHPYQPTAWPACKRLYYECATFSSTRTCTTQT